MEIFQNTTLTGIVPHLAGTEDGLAGEVNAWERSKAERGRVVAETNSDSRSFRSEQRTATLDAVTDLL